MWISCSGVERPHSTQFKVSTGAATGRISAANARNQPAHSAPHFDGGHKLGLPARAKIESSQCQNPTWSTRSQWLVARRTVFRIRFTARTEFLVTSSPARVLHAQRSCLPKAGLQT